MLLNSEERQQDTFREVDTMGTYLSEIGRFPLLTPAEEVSLSKVIEAGRQAATERERQSSASRKQKAKWAQMEQAAQKAKDKFVKSNLRLVVSVAKRCGRRREEDLLDMIQDGSMGLSHAVDKFDWRKGFKFSTYAVWWIRQSIARGNEGREGVISIPEGRSRSIRRKLADEDPAMGVLSAEESSIFKLTQTVSLDAPVGDSSVLSDVLADDALAPADLAVEEKAREDMRRIFANCLTKKESDALACYLGLDGEPPRSYREVGTRLGVSLTAARKWVERGLETFRSQMLYE